MRYFLIDNKSQFFYNFGSQYIVIRIEDQKELDVRDFHYSYTYLNNN